MKKHLLFLILLFFQLFSGQINFGPALNYDLSAYNATINGSGTIYYTTDGTDPTLSSAFGINTVTVPVTQNIVIKARLKDNNNQLSSVFSRPYYIGELPQKTVYFKPPSSWTSVCSYMNFIQPEFMVDFFGPGSAMTPACEGWYKASYSFYVASVRFNNCLQYSPNYQEINITASDTVFYDYSLGPITNPPACLLALHESSDKVAVIKVFPNPVQDFIAVESQKKFLTYEIIDATGKSLLQNKFSTEKINVAFLPAGTYFIKLTSLHSAVSMVKFIKK